MKLAVKVKYNNILSEMAFPPVLMQLGKKNTGAITRTMQHDPSCGFFDSRF